MPRGVPHGFQEQAQGVPQPLACDEVRVDEVAKQLGRDVELLVGVLVKEAVLVE